MIINLTQHAPTQEQINAGVTCVPEHLNEKLKGLLTFTQPPTLKEMAARAVAIAAIAKTTNTNAAMIGGAPYFMPVLTHVLRDSGIKPLFSFTERHSVDIPQPDGSVRKVAEFRHVAFVEA